MLRTGFGRGTKMSKLDDLPLVEQLAHCRAALERARANGHNEAGNFLVLKIKSLKHRIARAEALADDANDGATLGYLGPLP